MTDRSETAAIPRQGYKKGLPLAGLATAEEFAVELWKIARLGMTSNDAYAVQLGSTKASGGAWRARIAVLRGFKLIKTEGEKIGLSPLGQALVNSSNPAGQVTARRTALLSLRSYSDLVASFDGTALPEESVIATRLKFEYGKESDVALKAAQAFIESLRHAEMIDDTNVVRSSGNPAVSSSKVELGSGDGVITGEALTVEASDETQADEDATAAELDQAFAADSTILDEQLTRDLGDVSRAPGNIANSSVALSVTLDLSNFRADEIVQILNALKGM
ncbi:hypothetical protein ACIQH6_22440 [Micromonospora orduensis]|uniref:hypothetical protein n=1 Tax=Micromonospora orduensis TaxID=1420891 RepID=UPI003819C59B